MTGKIETNPKGPKFKVNNRVRYTKCQNVFSKVYTKNWWREILIIHSVLKTNLWIYKIKNLSGEIILGSFNEKELLWSKFYTSCYPEPDSHSRVRNEKIINHARGVDTTESAAKNSFTALKAEVDKLGTD